MNEPRVTKEVYTVVAPRQAGGRDLWIRIGSAWVNRDGSLSVRLNALPLDGQLQIRDPRPVEGGQR